MALDVAAADYDGAVGALVGHLVAADELEGRLRGRVERLLRSRRTHVDPNTAVMFR